MADVMWLSVDSVLWWLVRCSIVACTVDVGGLECGSVCVSVMWSGTVVHDGVAA